MSVRGATASPPPPAFWHSTVRGWFGVLGSPSVGQLSRDKGF